jgi:hypothetical protein
MAGFAIEKLVTDRKKEIEFVRSHHAIESFLLLNLGLPIATGRAHNHDP